jgi:hypothetical protein
MKSRVRGALVSLSTLAILGGATTIAHRSAAAPSFGTAAAASIRASVRAGETHPWLLEGVLSAPTTRAPELVARDVLATHAPWASARELAFVRTTTLPRGARVVAFEQRIDGVPVFSRGVRVVVEADGRTSTVTSAVEEARPASMVPRISTADAERAANLHAEHVKTMAIVWPTGGEPRLAWMVEGATEGVPSRPVVVVDAETGDVLTQWDATRGLDLANVYDQNPFKTPTLTQTTLPALAGKDGLQSNDVVAKNCIDNKTLRSLNGGQVHLHVCDLIPTITADASGDYTSIVPAGDTAPEDAFAELSIFFHASKAWSFARSIGFAPKDVSTPLVAIANFRTSQGYDTGNLAEMQNPNLPLAPLDNAFFAPAGQVGAIFGGSGDALWFGQGTHVDFSYDGDVVYHEFGHFVVQHTARLVGSPHLDAFGVTYSPGAINEGVADLFSCFITGDPIVGEYAGNGLFGHPFRVLDGDDRFPQHITGEVHDESTSFSQPVWKLYATLDATKQEGFRRAWLDALVAAPTGDLGYADFAALLETAVGKEVDDATAKALVAAFDARGISPSAPRAFDYDGKAIHSVASYGFRAPGRNTTGTFPFAPGVFQVRYPTRPGSYSLRIAWTYTPSPSGGNYVPQVLTKVGADPIQFQYGPLRHDATLTSCTDDGGSVECSVPVDVKVDADASTGTVYVMAVNSGSVDIGYNDVVVETPDPPPTPSDAGPQTDAAAAGAQASPDPTGSSGCAFDVPGPRGRTSAGLLALAIGALVTARRRRRS